MLELRSVSTFCPSGFTDDPSEWCGWCCALDALELIDTATVVNRQSGVAVNLLVSTIEKVVPTHTITVELSEDEVEAMKAHVARFPDLADPDGLGDVWARRDGDIFAAAIASRRFRKAVIEQVPA